MATLFFIGANVRIRKERNVILTKLQLIYSAQKKRTIWSSFFIAVLILNQMIGHQVFGNLNGVCRSAFS